MKRECFPQIFYEYQIPQDILVPLQDAIRHEYDNRENDSQTPGCWMCDVYSNFGNTRDIRLKYDAVAIRCIDYVLHNFYSEARPKFLYRVSDWWFNCYENGQFQEVHDHLHSIYSGIIYLHFDPKEHTPTVFKDPLSQIKRMTLRDENVFAPSAKEGTAIIFPAYMMHGVPPVKSSKLRTTISFNLVL